MLEETGIKVSIFTVQQVLQRHNLKGRLARKKPLPQKCHKKARLRFATAHGDKVRTFWRYVLQSDETKIELFGHNDHRYVRRKNGEACKPKYTIPTVKNRGGNILLWGCFAAGGLVHFTKQMASCREDNYVAILTQHLKTSVRKLQLGCKWACQMDNDPSMLPKLWQNGLRTTNSRYWSGHHKALTTILWKICGQN